MSFCVCVCASVCLFIHRPGWEHSGHWRQMWWPQESGPKNSVLFSVPWNRRWEREIEQAVKGGNIGGKQSRGGEEGKVIENNKSYLPGEGELTSWWHHWILFNEIIDLFSLPTVSWGGVRWGRKKGWVGAQRSGCASIYFDAICVAGKLFHFGCFDIRKYFWIVAGLKRALLAASRQLQIKNRVKKLRLIASAVFSSLISDRCLLDHKPAHKHCPGMCVWGKRSRKNKLWSETWTQHGQCISEWANRPHTHPTGRITSSFHSVLSAFFCLSLTHCTTDLGACTSQVIGTCLQSRARSQNHT